MVYLLLEDPRGIERLEQIKAQIPDPSMRDSNLVALDGQKVTPTEVSNACLAFPFLADKRIVLVRGLLARFRPRQRVRATSSKPLAAPPGRGRLPAKALEQEFAGLIGELPPHTDLVLLEAAPWPEQGAIMQALREAKAEILPPLKRDDLPRWIEHRALALGGKMAPGVAAQMADMVGDDLVSLDQDLDKLVTYAGGQPISWRDVQQLVGAARGANVFALVDRMAEGNAATALGELHRLLASGVALAQILAMVSRQFRLLLLWRELREEGVPEAEASRRLGVAPFVSQKLARQVGRYDLGRLEEIYRHLVDIDLAWKTGRSDPLPALEVLIAGLSLASRSSQKRRMSATTLP